MATQTREVKNLIQQISDLPALPSMLATLNRLMADPKTSAETLGKAIATDPGLTTKVLKLVNSAFYGFPGRIGTITQAIVILGFSSIRNLVLTSAIIKMWSDKDGKAGFDIEAFWKHSLQTAALSRALAFEKDLPFMEEAFIAGLLHDVGRLIISQKLPEEFSKILALTPQKSGGMREAELAILGTTHAEVGAWVGQKWNLPFPLLDAIEFHHNPEAAPERESLPGKESAGHLVVLVNLADELSDFISEGKLDWDAILKNRPELAVKSGLGEDGHRFSERAVDEIGKSLAFLEK